MEHPTVKTLVRNGRTKYRWLETVPEGTLLRIRWAETGSTKETTARPTTVIIEVDAVHLRNLCIRAIRNTRGRSQAGPISAKVWPDKATVETTMEPV